MARGCSGCSERYSGIVMIGGRSATATSTKSGTVSPSSKRTGRGTFGTGENEWYTPGEHIEVTSVLALLAMACLAFTVLDVMQLRRRLQTASTANRH